MDRISDEELDKQIKEAEEYINLGQGIHPSYDTDFVIELLKEIKELRNETD